LRRQPPSARENASSCGSGKIAYQRRTCQAAGGAAQRPWHWAVRRWRRTGMGSITAWLVNVKRRPILTRRGIDDSSGVGVQSISGVTRKAYISLYVVKRLAWKRHRHGRGDDGGVKSRREHGRARSNLCGVLVVSSGCARVYRRQASWPYVFPLPASLNLLSCAVANNGSMPCLVI